MFTGRLSDEGRWIATIFDGDYLYLGIRVYTRTPAS